MTKEKINSLQLASFIISFIIASLTGIGIYIATEGAVIDAWISVIISAMMGIVPLVMILYLFNFEQDKTITEKINYIFGKYLGFVINFLIVGIVFIIAATDLFNIANFLITQFLSETPLLVICLLFCGVSFYAITKGFETISRVNLIFVGILISFFVIFIATLIPQVQVENYMPILVNGIDKPIMSGFLVMLANIVPIFLILIVPKKNITDKKKLNKYLIVFYIIGVICAIASMVIIVGILGEYLIKSYQYPEYAVLKKISLFGFIERIENLLSLQWILSCFSLLTLCIYYISNTIKKVKKNKLVSIGVIAITIIMVLTLFKSNTHFNLYIYYIYPYILLGLLGLFVIVMIGAWVKKKKKNAINLK